MAESVKSLRRRLRSIKNTKQITRAMEMVSAAKLRRSQDLLLAGRPYATKLQELLGNLAGSTSAEHPLFEKRENPRRTILLITSDRGLAGSFNTQAIKTAEAFLREQMGPVDMVCCGRKGHDYFRRRQWPILRSITDMGGKLESARTNELAELLMERFLKRETDEVYLAYNRFVSTLVYRATLEKLLPLDPETLLAGTDAPAGPQVVTDYKLEPSPEAVFASLLPRFVRSKVYIAHAEVFTAEHSARMVSMSSATRNCEDLITSVSLRMNKARQAAITKEILEIVGGAEAISA